MNASGAKIAAVLAGVLAAAFAAPGGAWAGVVTTGNVSPAPGVNGSGWPATGYVYVATSSGEGAVTVDGVTGMNSGAYLYIGYTANGMVTLQNGSTMSTASYPLIGYATGYTGTLNVDGNGSAYSTPNGYIGGNGAAHAGAGVVNVTNGGQVRFTSTGLTYLGYPTGGSGTIAIDGVGSLVFVNRTLSVGKDGAGTVTITNGGLLQIGYVYANSGLVVDPNNHDDSFVNLSTGGMLAFRPQQYDFTLAYNATDLTRFLAFVQGQSDQVRYWSGSAWASITGATYGTDYVVSNGVDLSGSGGPNLTGYKVLTVGTVPVAAPEPTTMTLLAAGGLLMLGGVRRANRRSRS
ncbi:MAG: hypothetical protein BIFFINMI_01078 [Phycisphaerae bacterium]|nr:hypothetical protein [Phycisphaerae bacterium]